VSDDRGGPTPELDAADIAKMIEILRESGWRQAYLRMGDFELRLTDSSTNEHGQPGPEPSAPMPQPVATTHGDASADVAAAETGPAGDPPAAAPSDSSHALDKESSDPATHVVIRAQSLGIFWRSPQPGAPPFVELGDEVDPDTPLAIVEVMKMMTRITPGCSGRVVALHVENGELVEFDQPLITIAPA
jgi:acetyl-CoA carboxylase biotin carboxyl carrier protein